MTEPAAPPPFTLDIEDHGTTAVVRCHGKLLAGSTELLYAPVSQLLPTHQRLILDLADLTHMDSMGLGALVRLYVSSRKHGCELELRHIGKKIRDLLIMTNLLPAFTIVGEHDIRM
jgi:anti-anti-sigma factor